MTDIKSGAGVISELFQPIREYEYEVVCGASDAALYPKKFTLDHSKLGTVKNQKIDGQNIGACVAMVIAQLAESFYEKEMSEGYAYGKFRNATSRGRGLSVSTALKLWKAFGIVPKSMFDVLKEMPEMKEIVDRLSELDDYAKEYPIGGYVSLSYADKVKKDNLIKDALSRQASGELKGFGLLGVANNYFGESHCILISGWDDESDKYEFKNSYGESYGNKGYGYIPKSELDDVYLILFDDIRLPFADVDENAWYHKAVKNVFCSGLMKGTSETTFDPEKPVTRAEMATMLDRLTKRIDERFALQNKVINEKINL